MAKFDKKDFPNLIEYLTLYGLEQHIIDSIDRYKGNSYSGYYIFGWKDDREMINMIDLSNTPDNFNKDRTHLNWNMLNDGMDPISEKDWNKLKVDPYCETFSIPGNEAYE